MTYMYEKNMEIIIPTWNRAKYLDRTLSQFANSPFLDYKITIIDNDSNDNTQEICIKYLNIFPNLKIIKNNKNIGALANILRCYEIATEKYLWLVGDNDTYDFSNCSKLIDLIENENFDLIFVQGHDEINLNETCMQEIYELGYANDIIMQLGTISAYILKTELYTSECLQKGYEMINDWFPHFAFANNAFKNNFSVYILSNRVRIPDNNPNDSYNTLGLIKGWVSSNLIFEKKILKEGMTYFRNGHTVFTFIIGGVIVGKVNNVDNYRREISDLIIATIRAKGIIIGLIYSIIIFILSIIPTKLAKFLYNLGNQVIK